MGGKSAHGNHRTGAWINSLLPPVDATYTFIEPFAGMMGVLLQREPARREIANDMDGQVVNWWRAARDYPVELSALLDWTPGWSASLFGTAVNFVNQPLLMRDLDAEECVRHAYYFTLAVHWVRGGMIGRVRKRTYPADKDLKRARTVKDKKGAAMIRDLEGEVEGEGRADDDGIRRQTKTIREQWDTLEGRKQGRAVDDGVRRSPRTRREDWENSAAKKEGRPADDGIRRAAVSRWEWLSTYAGTGRRPADDGIKVPDDKPAPPGGYPFRYPRKQQQHSGGEMSPPRSERILRLHERILDIELEIRDAAWMLEYYASNPNTTWYLDPPYPSAAEANSLYTFSKFEVEPYLPLLLKVRGLVAVSGYGNEWSELEGHGWLRHEHETIGSVGAQHNRDRPKKTEVLWTNYDPREFDPQPGLFDE